VIRRLWCLHPNRRCLHGDEVLDRMSWTGRLFRALCPDCGKRLRHLPRRCTVTGQRHDPRLTP
jgi:hypothetical protein